MTLTYTPATAGFLGLTAGFLPLGPVVVVRVPGVLLPAVLGPGVLTPDLYDRLVLSLEKLLLALDGLFRDVFVFSLDGGFRTSD